MTNNKQRKKWTGDKMLEMKLFYDDNHSFAEVGAEFNLSASRVDQIFRSNHIKTRKKTVSRKFRQAMDRKRIVLPEEPLKELYTKEKLSIQKIAGKLNTSCHIVRRSLQHYGIFIRPLEIYNRSLLSPELLRRLYIDEKLTAKEIADRLGYAASTIGKKLSIFGINRRAATVITSQTNQLPAINSDQSNTDSTNNFTVEEIAQKYKLHPVTVRVMLRRGDFPNAFRQRKGKTTLWIIPGVDLEKFAPRRKGGERINAPTILATRSRGKYARGKIKQLFGYGRAEIDLMIDLKKQGQPPEEIAVRFRIEQKYVIDILEEAALRKTRWRKSVPDGRRKKTVHNEEKMIS